MYKVLWVDDQYKDPRMLQFAIEADNEGIFLEGFESFEEAFEVLENKIDQFDVILLDGLFFEKKGQVSGTEDEIGLGMAIAKINELKTKKIFPWFVLSGKDQFTKGKNPVLVANKARCFDKTNPSDVLELFKQIKIAANEQVDIQIKHKYEHILKVCTNKYIGENQYTRLFTLIKHVEQNEMLERTEDMLNPLRKIVESMFTSLSEAGLIPTEILKNNGWINGSSLFLSGKHEEYTHKIEFVHPLIAENIHRLLNITHDVSHGDGNLKLRADEYLITTTHDYLYRSCIYLLFDILVWFKQFIDKYPNKEKNKELYTINEQHPELHKWIKGEVYERQNNDWGKFISQCGKIDLSIPNFLMTQYELKKGDRIELIRKSENKKHIKELRKI